MSNQQQLSPEEQAQVDEFELEDRILLHYFSSMASDTIIAPVQTTVLANPPFLFS